MSLKDPMTNSKIVYNTNNTMIPLRRGVIAILLLIVFVVVFRSSSSSSASADLLKAERPNTNIRFPPQSRAGKAPQTSLEGLSDRPLQERLRYLYPYDVDSKFPAYIWQTWKYTPSSGWFSEELRPLEATWTELHPGFVHEVVTDRTAEHMIQYLYGSIPEVVEAYTSMPLPVLKADMFRYLILLARGGIYTDIDTQALQPAVDWLPEDMERMSIGLIVGIEADPDRPDWAEWYSRRIQFCQWTIQAKPGHPVLRDVVAAITEDTLRMKRKGVLTKRKMDKSIVEFTGPAVWTDAVFRYFNSPDHFRFEGPRNVTYEDFTGLTVQKRVGDVAVLPITSFSPGVAQMGSEEPDHPMAFVKHEFEGTWKPESERHMGEEYY